MEHLLIYFEHDIRDISPYYDFVAAVRDTIAEEGLGKYLWDDMAIDGGDATAVFAAPSARKLFEFLRNDLAKLRCMKGAKVTFVYGDLDAGANEVGIDFQVSRHSGPP